MPGSDRMKRGGGRCRCNYYRISSVVVMSFLILFVYWAMFTSPSVDGHKQQLNRFTERKRNMILKGMQGNRLNNFDETVRQFQGNNGDSRPRMDVIPKQENLRIDEAATTNNRDNGFKIPDAIGQKGTGNSGERLYKSMIDFELNKKEPKSSELFKENDPSATVVSPNRESGNEPQNNQNSQQGNDQMNLGTRSRFIPQPAGQNTGPDAPQVIADTPAIGSNTAVGDQNGSGDKWIIITTIQYPTEDVKFLAKLKGWQVVVAGDTKTPTDWTFPNCHYLSVEKQKTLGFETVNLLPVKSYSRKNAAYLYAIAHGARIIYETDDDNRPLDLLKHFIYEPKMSGLKFAGGKIFNPYRHFGQPTLWPRGYPLGYIGGNFTDKYELGVFKTPSIQQGVVNGDPDMDAIFRLTRKRTTEMLNVSFDGYAPPAILPPGVLVPFNSQNTLFLQDVLWALVLPTSVTFRVTDIWRGYWIQRLMWEIDANLGFFGPNAFQKRNSHSYVKDAQDEDMLYFMTHDLVDFLLEWKCDQSLKFFACAVKLTEDMNKKGFWKGSDVELIKAWFNDLTKLNYKEPTRKPFMMQFELNSQPNQDTSSEVTSLMFTAGEMFPPMYYDSKYIISSYWNRVQGILKFCDRSDFSLNKASFEQPTFPEIVLVVVFKDTSYDVIPNLNMLYASKFPHIVYCGSDISSYQKSAKSFTEPFTFVEANVQRGYYNYRCLSKAMEMGYRVSGYMMITSETLLNPWTIETMPRDRIWVDQSKYLSPIQQTTETLNNWPAWSSTAGKTAYNKAVLYISEESQRIPSVTSYFTFKKNLLKNSNFDDGLFIGLSDVFYIPTQYSATFATYLDMFSKYNVFHEVVVPTVIYGLELKINTLPLSGKYMFYDNEKQNFQQYFKPEQTFLNPINVQEKLTSKEGASFFCSIYLPKILGKTPYSGLFRRNNF
ncbi:uncharacterized protein LOC126820736 [Patella vulgata]|uniref:uncharacterized protein LOC126820736 n=1 Tax=Patella vulgata TaxID=6465 RepID=UPI0021808DFA|nr:uncharacterized protein LOC126820736 [Patella vulgata]